MQTGSILQPNNHDPSNGAQLSSLPNDDTPFAKPAAHSGRLVYAKPEDLPSFPSIGLKANGSAASAAASLGWSSNKSPDPWRPDKSASASAAAVLAKDYKMASAWEPTSSSHGAKAALLAAQAAKNPEARKPAVVSPGHSAATRAFQSDRNATRTTGTTALERQKSLYAAKGAMAKRERAKSSPTPRQSYPDEANAASNALAAATRAHKPATSPTLSEDAGAVPYTTMNRQMFTSRPPVKPETDEKKKADVLHASAVAMAKKMYTQQQKIIDAKKAQAEDKPARGRPTSRDSLSDDEPPMVFNSLQDAAYRQAHERLAKIHEDNLKNREYQDYYGARQPHRRFTMKNKLRRRASSDGAAIEDQVRSQHIRRQMSIFSTKLSEVDEQKRQHDRDALLAAAQRNVSARLKGMDEKISRETGMVPPSTLSQWELKAHAAAQSRSDDRADKHAGKVDVGAGLRLDQEAIDAIAARRVQPVLDEINAKVEKEHARQTQLRLEAERKKEEHEREKARQREVDEINKKLKEQEKQERREKRAEEKQEAKAKREEEKAKRGDVKVAQTDLKQQGDHEDQKRSTDQAETHQEEPEEDRGTVALNSNGQPVIIPRPETPPPSAARVEKDETVDQGPKSPSERSPRGRKVKSWFKSHFSKNSKSDEGRQGFIGGAALTSSYLDGNESSTSIDNRSASVRAVAMAGRNQSTNRAISGDRSSRSGRRSGAVSPTSSSSSDDDFQHDNRTSVPAGGLSPPRPIGGNLLTKSQSPVRDSRFHEIM